MCVSEFACYHRGVRIFITGGPGSGKTTFARRIADARGLQMIELDEFFRVHDAIDGDDLANRRAALIRQFVVKSDWVVEGVYDQPWVDEVLLRADHVIVLRISRWRRDGHLIFRTLRRMCGFEPSPRESSWRTLFSLLRFSRRYERERYAKLEAQLRRVGCRAVTTLRTSREIETLCGIDASIGVR